jgi:hypothetical protein
MPVKRNATYNHVRNTVFTIRNIFQYLLCSLLTQHACQTSQYISDSNAFRPHACFHFSISLIQAFARRTQDPICHPLCSIAVLLNLVHAVCKKVYIWFERLAQFG